MNRFIINLRSLNANDSYAGSLARQLGSSTLNFRIPNSFLGNIGEDLRDGDELTDSYSYDDLETDTNSASSGTHGSFGDELKDISLSVPDNFSSTNVKVSIPV